MIILHLKTSLQLFFEPVCCVDFHWLLDYLRTEVMTELITEVSLHHQVKFYYITKSSSITPSSEVLLHHQVKFHDISSEVLLHHQVKFYYIVKWSFITSTSEVSLHHQKKFQYAFIIHLLFKNLQILQSFHPVGPKLFFVVIIKFILCFGLRCLHIC